MTSNAKWHVTLTFPGKGAAILCRGNMPAKKSGCVSRAPTWKCAMAPIASPCMRRAAQRHQIVTQNEHHQGIPLGAPRAGKTLIHIPQGAPVVEQRPLEAYESLAT